jgi:hypothetical protein
LAAPPAERTMVHIVGEPILIIHGQRSGCGVDLGPAAATR